jgi:hypothetical protein
MSFTAWQNLYLWDVNVTSTPVQDLAFQFMFIIPFPNFLLSKPESNISSKTELWENFTKIIFHPKLPKFTWTRVKLSLNAVTFFEAISSIFSTEIIGFYLLNFIILYFINLPIISAHTWKHSGSVSIILKNYTSEIFSWYFQTKNMRKRQPGFLPSPPFRI